MFPQLGFGEMLLVMGVAVLLFGKKLPEVGRSLGRGIVEFKKGIRGTDDDISAYSSGSTNVPATRYAESEEPAFSVPKFEPPTSPPIARSEPQANA
jgi:sec-independent protein translocase protein TatA